MGSSTLVSLDEYLHTTYRPDCDYVDGEVLERNMGEQSHARLQGFLMALFLIHRDEWQLRSLTEQRVQVKSDRFRVPDVCVVPRSDPNSEILRDPPLLCIEVLSSKDSLQKLRPRIEDYTQMGVPHVWVIDPWKRVAYTADEQGYQKAEDGFLRLPGTEAVISVEELFGELDIA